jgi:multiple sugar transport system permease protein
VVTTSVEGPAAAEDATAGQANPGRAHVQATRRPSRRRRDLTGLAFIAPYLVLLVVLGLFPTLYSVYESLFDGRAGTRSFGLSNYTRIFTDFRFWPSVAHVGVYLAIWLPAMVVGVLFFALLLHHRHSRVTSALRLTYFLPGAVTGSASVLLWYCMLQPTLSPFSPVLHALGFETGREMFRTQHLVVIYALIAFTTGAGSWVMVTYGALQNLSVDVLEAAVLDGCGPVRLALLIKLPLVSKYVIYMVILLLTGGVQLFVEPALLGRITGTGSPWWSPSQLGYALAFKDGDFGGAATVSMLLLIVCLFGALLTLRTDLFSTELES